MPLIQADEVRRLEKRFVTRAKIVVGIRIAIVLISIFVLKLEVDQDSNFYFLNPLGLLSWALLTAVFIGSLAAYLFAESNAHGRQIYFGTLLIDIVWCTYIISYSQGLASPLMVLIPLQILVFSILFPGPVTVLFPLLMLPVITAWGYLIPEYRLTLSTQINLLFIYTIINGIIIHVTNSILSKEESQTRKILALQKKLKDLAVVEERSRLSRELHDGLGGCLSGLIIQSEYLLTLSQNNHELTKEIKELKLSAEDAIDEVRRAICIMKDDFDLVWQLKNCCNLFSTRHRLDTKLSIEGSPPSFSPEKQLTIFRIMQECLTNTSKHAKANQVNVRINFSTCALKMKIQDDGAGFNPEVIPKNHFGLLGIKERAKKMGGNVVIDSAPGKGTRVEFELSH